MNEIERAVLERRRLRIPTNDPNVAQLAPLDLAGRHIGEPRFRLEADDAASRTDALGEQVEYPNRTATYVRGAPTGSDGDVVEQPARFGLEPGGLDDQALQLGLASPEHIVA